MAWPDTQDIAPADVIEALGSAWLALVLLTTLGSLVTDETLIAEAGRRLAEAVPDARVILFGSHARGEAGPDSDLDLLVIEPELESRRAEFVRLRKELRGLEVAIDLVLVTTEHVEEWGHFEGTMLNEALREGRVLARA